jgi:hypothetical protein
LREALQSQGSKGALAFLAQMQSGEERASAEARVHDARKKSAMAALLSEPSACVLSDGSEGRNGSAQAAGTAPAAALAAPGAAEAPVGPAAGAQARLKRSAPRSCRPLAPAPTPTPAPFQNPNPKNLALALALAPALALTLTLTLTLTRRGAVGSAAIDPKVVEMPRRRSVRRLATETAKAQGVEVDIDEDRCESGDAPTAAAAADAATLGPGYGSPRLATPPCRRRLPRAMVTASARRSGHTG